MLHVCVCVCVCVCEVCVCVSVFVCVCYWVFVCVYVCVCVCVCVCEWCVCVSVFVCVCMCVVCYIRSMEVILLSNEVLSESPLFQNPQEETAARILKFVVPVQHSNPIDTKIPSLW